MRQNNPTLGPVGTQLPCMANLCASPARVWLTKFSAALVDVNGMSREPGDRHKHVCGRCAEEMESLSGWKPLDVW